MSADPATTKLSFSFAFAFSLLAALTGLLVPSRRMPIDFHLVFWLSLPLAGIWLATMVVSASRFRRKALWMLIGAPLALYWPVWLMCNGLPACYWHGNCR
jgi:hypothetical protein